MAVPHFLNMITWSFILFIGGAAGSGILGLIKDNDRTIEPIKRTSKTSTLGNTMKPLNNESSIDIEKEVLKSEEENGPLTSDAYERLLLRKISGGNYSKWAKPRSENGEPLAVQTRLYFIRIQELDEARETFYSTVRFQLVNLSHPFLFIQGTKHKALIYFSTGKTQPFHGILKILATFQVSLFQVDFFGFQICNWSTQSVT